jgi:methionine-rich copper-binding protein CopC
MLTSHLKNTTRFNRMFLSVVVGLTVSLLFLSQTQLSWAHARFKSANIQPDAVLTTVPASLTITFSEETSPTQTHLQVLDASGKAVDKGDLKIEGATATLGLNTLTDGKYTVKFRTFTEDDSNIVEGDYSFTVALSGTATSGDAGKANQVESGETEQPAAAPAAGFGGISGDEGNDGLITGVSALAVIGLSALGLQIFFRRRKTR